MKRLASIGLAALLTACATQPYGPDRGGWEDPYPLPPMPAPYPAPPPYPQPPYPPVDYPPPGYMPPAQQPEPMRCPITTSRDWRAWVNAMPGPDARPKLMVTGTVVVPTGGYQMGFEPYLQIRESYPAQAFATLRITPPQGMATQAITSHNLRWEWPLSQQVGSVEIRCGGDTLATISPVETAH